MMTMIRDYVEKRKSKASLQGICLKSFFTSLYLKCVSCPEDLTTLHKTTLQAIELTSSLFHVNPNHVTTTNSGYVAS